MNDAFVPEDSSRKADSDTGPPAPESDAEDSTIPGRLPLLPLRDAVVFPGTIVPLAINREKSKRVLDLALAGSKMIAVVAQRSEATEDPMLDDLFRVGTACVILKMLRLPDGTHNIIVHGKRRIGVESVELLGDLLVATVHGYTDPPESTLEQQALVHTIRAAAERIIELSPNIPDEAGVVLRNIEAPGTLADFLAANLSLSVPHKQELLETFDVGDRLRKVNLAVAAQLEVVELSHKIQEQVRGQVDKTQREYYLREQMKAIQQELGDAEAKGASAADLSSRIKAAKMPAAVETEALREVERLQRIPSISPEYSTALDYVEWLIAMPWSVSTEDSLELGRADEVLNEDHYGLTKVKKRILEFLAVRTLKSDSRGPILCFAGPPGVGKTSLGQSIARAMGRNFIRISLGGVHDEAAIRGHRRTYIGAMPGRIVREIRRIGCNNPLFMFDEVDKVGQDSHGDPMSALLEVLDPAQNSTFSDHYLGVPFDLSKVLFVCTANYMGAIEPALRDRMEIIELSSYTHYEKAMIARRHLIPRQVQENGLLPDQIRFSDEVLPVLISDYTREAGVRSLERKIGAVCRSCATEMVRKQPVSPEISVAQLRKILGPKEFESELAATRGIPGVVTGLAFTPVGGDILFIEARTMPGSGQLRLTGQLGDVMRESALAATTIVRSNLRTWRIPGDIYRNTDLHIHVPAGAIPKDGPSAGVALLTAIVSLLVERPVDPRTGMTGEITLSGRVLPVGGITEKVIAAHRAGLNRVILPARNETDLHDIPEDIRNQIEFILVNEIGEVLKAALGIRTAEVRSGKKRSTQTPPRLRASTKRSTGAAATRRPHGNSGHWNRRIKTQSAEKTPRKATPAAARKR